ncbi:MAG: AraC family transcriptional regulator [Butyrivibrio sp.]|nr:AraC family transcriptional regulator [Butyrivibrio sp.]
MPLKMPKDAHITIQKRNLPSDFSMPQMEMAESHYSLGYIISGDRRFITPYERYEAHPGDITAMPPGLYHRTFSLSDSAYENYLIKVSPDIAESFRREVDPDIWDYVFNQKLFSFDDLTRSKIESILSDMLEIYTDNAPYCEALLKGLIFRLLVLIRDRNINSGRIPFKGELSKDIMEAMYYIEKNYAEPLKLGDVAGSIGFSEGHFSRLFAAKVGTSFSGYLVNIRLRHAKELLINTDLPISDIALQTGFGSGDYFSACFSKHEGITPTAFRTGEYQIIS